MTNFEKELEIKRRKEKIEQILNHKVEGEGFINAAPSIWKKIILLHFNKVSRGEMTVEQLISLLESKGVTFNQSKQLIRFPVIHCLEYIAKISKTKLELER